MQTAASASVHITLGSVCTDIFHTCALQNKMVTSWQREEKVQKTKLCMRLLNENRTSLLYYHVHSYVLVVCALRAQKNRNDTCIQYVPVVHTPTTIIQHLRTSKATPELSKWPQRSRWNPSLCTFLNSPLLHNYYTLLPLSSLYLPFHPSFLPFLPVITPLLFPASWLSFGSTGGMTDEREETRDGDIKERKNGLLFGVAPRTSYAKLWRFYAHIQSTVNSSNETALCAILNISQIFTSRELIITANVPITLCKIERDGETGTNGDVKWPTVFPKGSLWNNKGQMMVWQKE